jgi:hypothetical protein
LLLLVILDIARFYLSRIIHYPKRPQELRTNPEILGAMGKPADYAPILNSVMWLQVGIATLFIALRLYTRYFIIRCLGWDDLVMVINLVRLLSPLFQRHAVELIVTVHS